MQFVIITTQAIPPDDYGKVKYFSIFTLLTSFEKGRDNLKILTVSRLSNNHRRTAASSGGEKCFEILKEEFSCVSKRDSPCM